MREIELTQNQVALVDDEDFEELNQYKWCASKGNNTFYARRYSGIINGRQNAAIYMHNEIVGYPPEGFMTDHRNGNGLHNFRDNLRHVTTRQNQQNRKNAKETSQYPGVYWFKQQKKWHARIWINGKSKHLGYFTLELDAFIAYKQAVESLGEKVIDQ